MLNNDPSPRRFDETPSGVDFSKSAGGGMRMASQVFGLILVVIGGYFGLQLASDLLGFVRNPADWEGSVGAMSKTLNLGELGFQIEGRRVSADRTIALGMLLLGYFICTWVAMRLVVAGGRLVAGAVAERQEFYAAMKEFQITMRREASG